MPRLIGATSTMGAEDRINAGRYEQVWGGSMNVHSRALPAVVQERRAAIASQKGSFHCGDFPALVPAGQVHFPILQVVDRGRSDSLD